MGGEARVEGFVAHWGWIYVVFQMAEFYRCSRDEIYNMRLIEFYNDMAFMKDKGKYDIETVEKQMQENKYG